MDRAEELRSPAHSEHGDVLRERNEALERGERPRSFVRRRDDDVLAAELEAVRPSSTPIPSTLVPPT